MTYVGHRNQIQRWRMLGEKINPLGGFLPPDIGGVTEWIDYSDVSKLWTDVAKTDQVDADGDVIGNAETKAVGGTDLEQGITANKPLYKTGIQNGLSVGRFDDMDDWMDWGGVAKIPATDDWAFYGVLSTGADVAGVYAFYSQYLAAAGNGRFIIWINGSTLKIFLGDEGAEVNRAVVAGSVSINTTYVFSFRREGDTFTGRLDGVDGTPLVEATTRNILQSGNIVGASTNNATNYKGATLLQFYNKDLMEFVIQVATPSADNLTNMDTYFNDKWSV